MRHRSLSRQQGGPLREPQRWAVPSPAYHTNTARGTSEADDSVTVGGLAEARQKSCLVLDRKEEKTGYNESSSGEALGTAHLPSGRQHECVC